MSTSRLAKKYATNKNWETQGILYEEVDSLGPLFQVRLARLGGQNKKYHERINELMKPYRKMRAEDIPTKKRDSLYLQAFCETVVLPGTWQTWVQGTDENDPGKYVDGIEDPQTGNLLPATAKNYQLVLEQLGDLADRLLSEAMSFDNYRAEALEAESKN